MQKSQFRRLTLLLALSAGVALRAQHPSFRVFTTQDGLVRNWITKIHRDSKGFLWFCTVEGISFYDGYRFTNFTTKDGLPIRLVNDMVETPRGDIWFATDAGLAGLQDHHGKGPLFNVVRVGATKQSNEVHALLQSRDGTIWCGTAAGLYRFIPASRKEHAEFVPLEGSRPLDIQFLAEDSHGNLWIASGQELLRRHTDGKVDARREAGKLYRFKSMLLDQCDRLWLGGSGFMGIDMGVEPPRPMQLPSEKLPRSNESVTALYSSEHGDIWIGKIGGISRFRPDAVPAEVVNYPFTERFPIDLVNTIEQDERHHLWLGVGTLGAVRIEASSAERYTRADGLETEKVSGMMESSRGTPYAITGEWNYTLNEFTDGRFVPIPMLTPRLEQTWASGPTIVQDRHGAWWAASGGGVLRYAPVENPRHLKGRVPERVYSVADGLPSATILRLFRDSRDDIWAGTTGGVGHWTRATGRWQGFRTADLIPDSNGFGGVHSFAEDCDGNVWVGMYPNGLLRFSGLGFKLFTHDIPKGQINSLLADHRGRLWIGSSQGGVGRIDNPAADEPGIQHYSVGQGLASEHTYSLAEDNLGNIYVANGRGVDRLDPDTQSIRHFTASSGLPPGDTHFLFRDREGSMWFVSYYGLSRYRPEPDEVSPAPIPLIRGLTVGGARFPISIMGERSLTGIKVAPGRNSLEVDFRALHFDTREGLRYQYRLRGSETDWSKPSEDQTVRFASLSPGRYRFEARSITDSGKISAGQASVNFEILAPFWKRLWFLAIVIVAVLSGTFLLHRYRVNHLLALERVRTRLASDLHDDLGADLAEIAILSEVAKLEQHSRAVELLDGIAGRARSLRGAMTDIVWSVDPREDTLAALVLRMRQVAFSILENESRSVEFLAPSDERLQTELDPATRRHVLLFFKEAVTNVARHARATAVCLDIQADKGHFRMSIRDNGCGFNPQQLFSGRGLRSLQYRAVELGGKCRVQSVPGEGTEIVLSLLL